MAVSTTTVTVDPLTGYDETQKYQIIRGTIAVSASPGTYPTGGYAVSLVGLTTFAGPVKWCFAWSQPPAASPNTSVYSYGLNPGTNLSNLVLQIFTGSAAQSPGAELSAGATPAGVSGDTIAFEAWIPKL